MTFTRVHYSAALATAPTSKRDRDRDLGLGVWLMREQGGICFDCGTAPATEFAHFVRAQGKTTRGMDVLGAMACRDCNIIHDVVCETLETDGTLPFEYLAANGRADRIITAYPERSYLVNVAADYRDHAELRDEAARRLAEIGL